MINTCVSAIAVSVLIHHREVVLLECTLLCWERKLASPQMRVGMLAFPGVHKMMGPTLASSTVTGNPAYDKMFL